MVTQEYFLGNNGKKVPVTCTSDWGREFVQMRNEAVRNGMKLFSGDEIMAAWHDERAGGEGMSRLWKQW
jgi:hypothetical protein